MFAESDEIRIVTETIRQAAREKIAPVAATTDATGELDRDVLTLLWDLGLMTMAFPPEHGARNRTRARCSVSRSRKLPATAPRRP